MLKIARALEIPAIEYIQESGITVATIIRAWHCPGETTFVTDDTMVMQAGFIVYKAGQEVRRHYHQPITRTIQGTPEAVFVRQGSCRLDLYSNTQQLLAERILNAGDLVLLQGAGHGFTCLEDVVLFEIKQGPYGGHHEKVLF
jgi:hypothetical protein